MSLRIRSAPFGAAGARRRAHPRRAFTLVELLVVISIIGMLMALLFPAVQGAFENSRQNTCRNNMRQCALAVFQSANRTITGELPGYMNVLKRDDETPYVDPTTGQQVPVSWVVMVLPELDRQQLYTAWRKNWSSGGDQSGGGGGGQQGGGGGGQQGGGTGSGFIPETRVYLEFLVCPSDPQPNRSGTPTCYVVNTGCQDTALGAGAGGGGGGGGQQAGGGGNNSGSTGTVAARDHLANGMFFDNYTLHPLVTKSASNAGYQVMSYAAVSDPKDKTILLTENIDATNYTFGMSADQGGGAQGGGQQSGGGTGQTGGNSTGNFQYAEVETGCIWTVGTISPQSAPGVAPTMQPTVHSMRINVDGGMGDGISYNYCRPSSKHPNGINIAFVDNNVRFVKDTLSYLVYCKLMSSNDTQMKLPGTMTPVDQALRLYQMNEVDVNP